MKSKMLQLTVALSLLLGAGSVLSQPPRGAGKQTAKTTPSTSEAQQALTSALTGPNGEYAAYTVYAAIVQQFGEVQPYAAILRAEERHIAALKRHFEMRGLPVPENPFAGKLPAPATLKEAAAAAVTVEERNVALYEQLLNQVQNQPDLVQVFMHLQGASQECHLPAFKAAAAKGGQLEAGEFGCGMGCGQGKGGPPAWAGQGQGMGRGAGCGACPWGQASGTNSAAGKMGRGYRHGAMGQGAGCQAGGQI